MSHRNAPLSFEGRLRLLQRCQQRPISHVAAEMGISRACASKWVNRWRRHGELGLHDRPSTPHHSPDASPAWVIERIETWRREKKWSANRITHELAELNFRINRRTVTRHLTRLGLGQRRAPDGAVRPRSRKHRGGRRKLPDYVGSRQIPPRSARQAPFPAPDCPRQQLPWSVERRAAGGTSRGMPSRHSRPISRINGG